MKKYLHKALFYLTDFWAAVLAWVTFYFLRKHILGETGEPLSFMLLGNAFIIAVFWVMLYSFLGFYNDIYRKSRIKEFLRLLSTCLVGAIIIFFVLLLDDEGVNSYKSYYKTFATFFLLQFSYTSFLKLLLLTYIKQQVKNRKVLFNTIIIGSGSNAREIFDAVEKSHELLGFTITGYVHLTEDGKDELKLYLPNLGRFEQIGDHIVNNNIQQVVIAVEQKEHNKIQDVLRILENYNVKVSIIPDIYELLLGSVKVNHVFSVPLIEITQDLIPEWQKTIKRGMDIFISLNVLVLGFPFLLAVSVITKLTSKGPVFYMQERIGKDGVPFRIIKFRSMYVNAESAGPALSSSKDPRITKWGRFMRRTKIDEFPQFYNVLIGDMSLVGPRPERQFFIDQILKIAPHYKHLQRVKPGVTSLGQVKYGYAENVEQMVKRLKYDIIYIENMSLAMDFQIILYTLLIMISGRSK